MIPLINIKLRSIISNLNTQPLTCMNFAYELFKLGKIIIDSSIKFNKVVLWKNDIMIFSNEQLEYIAKSIHTCIINKNSVFTFIDLSPGLSCCVTL